jgi:long-subunit fatty acid transport protein
MLGRLDWTLRRSIAGLRRSVVGLRRSVVVLLVLASTAAHAGGFSVTIFGVRRIGMGPMLANPDDGTALFQNPAGLADLPGTRLYLSSGFTALDTTTRLQALDPGRFPEVNPEGCGTPGGPACRWPVDSKGYYTANFKPESYVGVIPYLGASQSLEKWSPRLRGVTVSAAAYAPGAYGAKLSPSAPTAYYVVSGLFVVIAATVGAGWRINDYVAVGVSASYNYMRLGFSENLSTTDTLTPTGEQPSSTVALAQQLVGDLRLDYTGTDHGFGYGAGVLVTPSRFLALGLTYSGATAPTFKGNVSVRGLGSVNSGGPSMDADAFRTLAAGMGYKLPHRLEVGMPIPPAFGAGLSVFPTRWMEIGIEGRLWLYTLYKKQVMRPIYDPNETGEEPLTEASLSKNKDYSNSWDLAVGWLGRPFRNHRNIDLMVGVSFDRSPVPDKTFSIDNPSMDQLAFSGGMRITLGSHWRLGAAYMYNRYLGRNVTTSQTWPPTNVRMSGASHIPVVEMEYIY